MSYFDEEAKVRIVPSIIIFAITIALNIPQLNALEFPMMAIVNSDHVNVREEPSMDSRVIMQLNKNSVVTLTNVAGSKKILPNNVWDTWFCLGNGKGWINGLFVSFTPCMAKLKDDRENTIYQIEEISDAEVVLNSIKGYRFRLSSGGWMHSSRMEILEGNESRLADFLQNPFKIDFENEIEYVEKNGTEGTSVNYSNTKYGDFLDTLYYFGNCEVVLGSHDGRKYVKSFDLRDNSITLKYGISPGITIEYLRQCYNLSKYRISDNVITIPHNAGYGGLIRIFIKGIRIDRITFEEDME
jgi:hypothetical protein